MSEIPLEDGRGVFLEGFGSSRAKAYRTAENPQVFSKFHSKLSRLGCREPTHLRRGKGIPAPGHQPSPPPPKTRPLRLLWDLLGPRSLFCNARGAVPPGLSPRGRRTLLTLVCTHFITESRGDGAAPASTSCQGSGGLWDNRGWEVTVL